MAIYKEVKNKTFTITDYYSDTEWCSMKLVINIDENGNGSWTLNLTNSYYNPWASYYCAIDNVEKYNNGYSSIKNNTEVTGTFIATNQTIKIDLKTRMMMSGWVNGFKTQLTDYITRELAYTKPKITNITVSDETYNSAKVTLTSTTGNGTLIRYGIQLYKNEVLAQNLTSDTNQTSTTFTFTGLEPETIYSIKAWSINEEIGQSDVEESSLTTKDPAVGEPTIENFSIINAQKIKLKCNASNEPNISGGIPKLYYRVKKGQEEILNGETVGSLDSEFDIESLEQNNTLIAYIVGGFTYNGKTYYSKEVESKLIRFIPNSWMEIFPFNSTQHIPVEVYICPYGETNNTKLILVQSSRTQGGG